ncbi:MAG TPA: class I SAM-dependent methyltransferase [Candidatus Acidoferrales bacterium]|nr:class I SAM-dependent methyltransferase [Candidatus Acidoferrales bacterium]
MTAYDEVAYPTNPKRTTHPDHLAAMGRIFGMSPAPPDRCRVMEVGCGTGGNLIPMALTLPGASLLGIDLAPTAIQRGAATISRLGLRNVELRVADLCTVGPDLGRFDYLIFHGLYSWVPPSVRDRILGLAGELLAPQGIAFVSYNCYPGRHIRNLFREIVRYHASHFAEPEEKVAQSRAVIRFLADVAEGGVYRALLREEADSLAKRPAGAVYHDDLAEINDPVLFTDFVRHAASHGLQYLSDSEYATTQDSNNALSKMDAGFLEHEQYLDFVRCRSFRQTLLCPAAIPLERPVRGERLSGLWFSSMARAAASERETVYESNYGTSLRTDHPLTRRILDALIQAYPSRMDLNEVLRLSGGADESIVLEILLGSFTGGAVDIHSIPAPCAGSAGERPLASPLARLQAVESPMLATLTHVNALAEDDLGRRLVQLLDGTRDRAALLAELGPPADADSLEEALRFLARSGVLVS